MLTVPLLLQWPRVIPEPVRVPDLIQLVFCELEHSRDHLGLVRIDNVSVPVEKQIAGEEGSALVAVHEAMILAEACSVGGSEIEEVWLAVDAHVPRASQSGFDCPLLADSERAAEIGDG